MNHLIKSYVVVLALQFVMLPQEARAQDQGFIYGRISTEEGRIYEGPLRWGKEEIYWTDMFNSSKTDNPNIDYLSREDIEDLRRRSDWGDQVSTWFSSNWGDRWGRRSFTHQFSCQFGELKSLKVYRRNDVEVELRDGTRFEVDGDGYNDIGTRIRILDEEIGEVEISWSRIEEIEFIPTPKKLDRKFGEPLYGTVETDYGEFTGFVQWDHDERVSTDVLDGDTYDGDVSIPFGKIASIENLGNRAGIVLKSGRDMTLRGSNDVNSDNDGIIVTIEGVGRVDIRWRDFEKVTFTTPPSSGKAYNDFKDKEPISGVVNTRQGSLKGRIIFDLDEEFDIEILHGQDDDLEYIIPFRNVKSIAPKSYRYSEVELKNGMKLRLEESQDVTEKNTGILVFENSRPTYIPWEEVESIDFD